MRFGIVSGALWGLDTVILGIALMMTPFIGAANAALAGALIHDVFAALILLGYMAVKGRLRHTLAALRTRSGAAVMGGALLGGPLGMTGYVIAIDNIGAGYTAIISSFYPALGTLFAFLFLKERMRPRQLLALLAALAGIVVIGWASSSAEVPGSAFIGIAGAVACVVGWGSEAVILAWGMRDDAVDNETALHIRETTSALIYIVVVGPLFGVLDFSWSAALRPATGVVALAALAGTVSYLFYYRAIDTIGASRGMALNISYAAWALFFGAALSQATPTALDIICAVVILVGTVLAATPHWKDLIPNGSLRRSGSSQ